MPTRLTAFTLALIAAATLPHAHAEEAGPRKVTWEDLRAKVEFKDPFADLSEEQLQDLGLVSRVETIRERDGGKGLSADLQKRATQARARLEAQGIDIVELFAKRKEITEMQLRTAGAAVPALEGTTLSLSGFVLPLEHQGQKVSEFLLVPWVGACIHTPPPPPNQIVHVIAAAPFESKGLFEPVTVTATMKVGSVKKDLFLVDGSAVISMGYSMPAARVVKYQQK